MNVAIVKYNAGNIYSVVNALKRLGITPELTDDAERLSKADRVLFPGQGEAGSTMAYLRSRGLDRLIRDLKQPVLGICIGQQLRNQKQMIQQLKIIHQRIQKKNQILKIQKS